MKNVKKDNGCANCGQPRVKGSTLCADCLAAMVPAGIKCLGEMLEEKLNLVEALKVVVRAQRELIEKMTKDAVEERQEIVELYSEIDSLKQGI